MKCYIVNIKASIKIIDQYLQGIFHYFLILSASWRYSFLGLYDLDFLDQPPTPLTVSPEILFSSFLCWNLFLSIPVFYINFNSGIVVCVQIHKSVCSIVLHLISYKIAKCVKGGKWKRGNKCGHEAAWTGMCWKATIRSSASLLQSQSHRPSISISVCSEGCLCMCK